MKYVEVKPIATTNDLKNALTSLGYRKGKITHDPHYKVTTIAIGPWIDHADILAINIERAIGLQLRWRTLSWYECLFTDWILK